MGGLYTKLEERDEDKEEVAESGSVDLLCKVGLLSKAKGVKFRGGDVANHALPPE